jgi:arginyl-tRNA synthetase
MSSLREQLTATFADAFAACGLERKFGQVVVSQRPDLGQFQCNGALAAAGVHKDNSRQIAQGVIDALEHREALANVSLTGPGFINITLADEFLTACVQRLTTDERLGCSAVPESKKIVIDFGNPNVAKPMHVGHLRSTIIGNSLQRLCCFMGHHVISDTHLGDWGTPMGMLISELEQRQADLSYFNPDYTGPYPPESPVTIADLQEMYPNASIRCQGDEKALAAAHQATVELQQGRPGFRALWQHFVDISIKELKDDFDSLGVTFDLWLGESDYHDRIPSMLEQLQLSGYTQLSDGALVIPLVQESDQKEIPPLILVKSDGGFLYGTTDLATIQQRVDDFGADEILYVVDARQSLHFEQVFRAARKTGLAQDVILKHIAFGTMNGPDGKPFKTRAGGVIRLKDLITMVTAEALERMTKTGIAEGYGEAERLDIARKVGLAALKFADLMNHRTSDYVFDLERFTKFEGRTGPYLLYTAVRIKSILRKAEEKALVPGPILTPTHLERDLMLALCQLPDAVQNSYWSYVPHHLCDFAYHLAQTFNRFYDQCHILSKKNSTLQSSWLALAQLSLSELELLLSLLGIETPDRM